MEPHRVPDVPHPVLGRRHVPRRTDRNARRTEPDLRDRLAEVVQHRLHQRRVECVRHLQPLALPSLRGREHLVLDPSDHHRPRPVDSGNRHTVSQMRQHLVLRRDDRHHRPAGRQRLHERRPRRDKKTRVLKTQHPGDMCRRDLTDRMPGHLRGRHPERLQQPVQRHLDREDRRLRHPRLVQRLPILTPHDIPQTRIKVHEHRVQRLREHRKRLIQLPRHPQPLRPLPGEDEGKRTVPHHPTGQLDAVPHHGPVVEQRPSRHQREPGVHRAHAAVHQRADLLDLSPQRRRRLRRHRQRHGPQQRNRSRLAGPLGGSTPHPHHLRQV